VPEILIDQIAPWVRLEVVVTGLTRGRLIGGNDRRAVIDQQSNVALQPDGVAKITAGRKNHSAAARGCRGIDGTIDGGGIQRLSVSDRSMVANVVHVRRHGNST